MRIAYFDCFSGVSGDMTVGAMISAGLTIEHVRSELKKLDLDGYSIGAHTLERSMIAATKFEVVIDGNEHHVHQHNHEQHVHAHHGHEHHGHAHNGHEHEHSHGHGEVHVHADGLSYREICDLIERSTLAERVRERERAIFRVIAEAEAVIHGVTLETVHFHEVGAVDSIVDIVATAIGLEHFAIDECRSRVVPLGAGGFVTTAHGRMPIPTPATLAILTGYPTELGKVNAEMTTPTGAGIIKALSAGVLSNQETLRVEAIGYGAGSKEFSEQPNLLRLVIGELETNETTSTVFPETDTVTQITAAIDDMTPTALAYTQERLLASGALDAYIRPIQMKKARAAFELVVLCTPESDEEILAIIASETTTIGVRVEEIVRRKARRTIGTAQSATFGQVRIKRIDNGVLVRTEPEFEDVKRISAERGLPFQLVLKHLREELP